MAQLVDYAPDQHLDDLRRLWTAYLEDGAVSLKEVGYEEDVPAVVADDLAHTDQFTPPGGRLLLAVDAGTVLGCGAVRVIGPGVAEIKRMYLRSEARGKGLGRMMIERLLDEARAFGCQEARLDTGWFMTDAHRSPSIGRCVGEGAGLRQQTPTNVSSTASRPAIDPAGSSCCLCDMPRLAA